MSDAVRLRHGRHASHAYYLSIGALVGCGGCAGNHAALNPAGEHASSIASLWWLFLITVGAVYGLTMLCVLVPVLRSWRMRHVKPASDELPDETRPQGERRRTQAVWVAVFVTVVILIGLIVADFSTGRSLHAGPQGEPLRIRLTARQWWWEARYDHETPSEILTTANEIHIPVGRPVVFELRSSDVIHSFWIPNLHGKKDMIPDHPTTTWLRADTPGEYWGQCAEFCGYQHAKMRLLVVAEPPEEFEAWRAAQLAPAPEPMTDQQTRGRDVFLQGTCILCHTIAGTDARGRVGPVLTHIASRKMIASNWLPNRPGHLAGWIVDPQKIKPGVRMPQNNLPPADLRALLEYLESLK
jgi:cytochrome c oxidase subunit II